MDAFIDSRLQKHISREVRLIDAIVKGKDTRWNPHTRRHYLTAGDEGGKDEAEDVDEDTPQIQAADKPTKNNPIMVCLYGQLCLAVRSYQSGICKQPATASGCPVRQCH